MSFFNYVQWMDIVAVIAVFFLMFNLTKMTVHLVQVHALVVTKEAISHNFTWNVVSISLCAVIIYWHIFIPRPGM